VTVTLQQQVLLAMIDNIRKAKTVNHSVAKAISTSNVMQGLATVLICSGNFCSHCHKVKVRHWEQQWQWHYSRCHATNDHAG